jgi:hypothetical protein
MPQHRRAIEKVMHLWLLGCSCHNAKTHGEAGRGFLKAEGEALCYLHKQVASDGHIKKLVCTF